MSVRRRPRPAPRWSHFMLLYPKETMVEKHFSQPRGSARLGRARARNFFCSERGSIYFTKTNSSPPPLPAPPRVPSRAFCTFVGGLLLCLRSHRFAISSHTNLRGHRAPPAPLSSPPLSAPRPRPPPRNAGGDKPGVPAAGSAPLFVALRSIMASPCLSACLLLVFLLPVAALFI